MLVGLYKGKVILVSVVLNDKSLEILFNVFLSGCNHNDMFNVMLV